MVSAETGRFRIPESVERHVLETLSMPEARFHLDPDAMRLSSSFELTPFQRILVRDPLNSTEIANRLTISFTETPVRISKLIMNAAVLIHRRTGLIAETKWNHTPIERIEWQNMFGENDSADWDQHEWLDSLDVFLQSTSKDLQTFIYHFIKTVERSLPRMKLGYSSMESIVSFDDFLEQTASSPLTPEIAMMYRAIGESADIVSILHAGTAVISCLDTLIEQSGSLDLHGPEAAQLTLRTPYGPIIVGSQGNDHYSFTDTPFLIIDSAGDDIYENEYAKSDHNRPFSFVIDLQGEDRYTSQSTSYGAGSSFFGCSGLYDLGDGSDRYDGDVRCFGYSFAGVSVLYDEMGDAQFNSKISSLGSSDCGVALLINGDGNDTYRSIHASQGYGALGGFGALIDRSGHDTYIAAATPALVPSAQLPDHNFSACQGFGAGFFGPNQNGVSLPGGFGILIDGQGDDLYQAGVFAQGSGYGYGIGLLVDCSGNDRYQAAWYAMGAAAHQGCGVFLDSEGNDEYSVTHYMMAGCATDYSVASFWDKEGDDMYSASNTSYGSALFNALAIFVDRQGNDSYRLNGTQGFGFTQNEHHATLRGLWPTYGLFFDLGGIDQYPNQHEMKNHFEWIDPFTTDSSYLLSIGIDWDKE